MPTSPSVSPLLDRRGVQSWSNPAPPMFQTPVSNIKIYQDDQVLWDERPTSNWLARLANDANDSCQYAWTGAPSTFLQVSLPPRPTGHDTDSKGIAAAWSIGHSKESKEFLPSCTSAGISQN